MLESFKFDTETLIELKLHKDKIYCLKNHIIKRQET